MQTQRVQKLITFSPQLYSLLTKKAGKLGLSFPEYIRIIAVNDIKEEVEKKPLELVSEETEKVIAKGMEDIRAGRYTTVRTDKELTKYLESLNK